MVQQLSKISLTEYFEREEKSDTRHEYIHGEVMTMAGGTVTHNTIIANLLVLLHVGLQELPYQVFVTDQRLWIPDSEMLTYPDLMVTAAPPVLLSGRNDTVMNPILIAEVLSESTESYDRGEKFAAYRAIPTLQEYLLISQKAMAVEQFTKEGDRWFFRDYPPTSTLTLGSLPVVMAIAAIYRRVDFAA
jgi:Uma2 family endonuclease